jgi:hypothetical protein
MHFLTVATLVTFFLASYCSTASTGLGNQPPSGVTYQDIYNYAIKMTGGEEDFTASLVKNHVATSERAWSDTYQNDIHLEEDGNGVLTVPGDNTTLSKRGSSMTAYPYSLTCDGYGYTWSSPGTGCYGYWSGGKELQIDSITTSGLSGIAYLFTGGNCNSFLLQRPLGGCETFLPGVYSMFLAPSL